MYYADHEPAHFHAIAGEDEIVVSVADIRVIRGPRAARRGPQSSGVGSQTSRRARTLLDPVPHGAEAENDRRMKLRTIRSAKPLPASRVQLVWDDGTESVVDLAPVLAKSGVFTFLTDPAAFNAVAVGPRGRTLVWQDPEGDEIDLCADALWRLARQGATEAA
jgi:hypothetical protein